MQVIEFPQRYVRVYGIKDEVMLPIAEVPYSAPEDREEIVMGILDALSSHQSAVIGNSVIFTEKFDGFRVF